MSKTVLIVGGGGREHALAKSLASSPQVTSILVASGNGGTTTAFSRSTKISNVALPDSASSAEGDDTNQRIVQLAKSNNVDLVVPGPEAPLVDGLTDALKAESLQCFGPSQAAARLEGSKSFFKEFAKKHGLPTPESSTFSDFDAAVEYVKSVNHDVVIKASGLASGKGVIIPDRSPASGGGVVGEGGDGAGGGNKASAEEALRRVLVDKEFGDAGNECIVEQYVEGDEISAIGFCDGNRCLLMPNAQDHKRAYERDEGPNTGGMGAVCPAPMAARGTRLAKKIEGIMDKTVKAMKKDGTPFVGFLFGGFIVSKGNQEVKLLEFNCRLGDPEAQVMLPLVESDVFTLMTACCNGKAEPNLLHSRHGIYAATVVLAAVGYPGSAFERDIAVPGRVILDAEMNHDATVYHAGTRLEEEGSTNLVSTGGRIFSVTAMAPDLQEAVTRATAASQEIQDGVGRDFLFFRSDIGGRALSQLSSQKNFDEMSKPIQGISELFTLVLHELGPVRIIAVMSLVVMIQASVLCSGTSNTANGLFLLLQRLSGNVLNINFDCEDEPAFAVSAGVIGLVLALVVELTDFKEKTDWRFYSAALLALWWIVSGLVLTFQGPFLIASNSWLASWINIIASLVVIDKYVYPISQSLGTGLQAAGAPNLFILVAALVVFFAGLSECVSNDCSEDLRGFAVAAGMVSVAVHGPIVYLTRPRANLEADSQQKVGRYGSGFLLLWWLAATSALTFAGPAYFVTVGNGFIGCWAAVAGSFSLFRVYSPEGLEYAMDSVKRGMSSMKDRMAHQKGASAAGGGGGGSGSGSGSGQAFSSKPRDEEAGGAVDV